MRSLRPWAWAAAASITLAGGACSSRIDEPGRRSEVPGLVDPLLPSGLRQRPANPSCLAPERPIERTEARLEPAFLNLAFEQPVLFLHEPERTSPLYVVEKVGAVRRFEGANGTGQSELYLDLRNIVETPSESGLLGLAFHPDHARNGYLYVSYNDNGLRGLRSVISRFTVPTPGGLPDRQSERVLMTVDQPFDNHKGGNIAFGPDGYLYIGFGDGGSGGDPGNRAQNVETLLGKFLRIDVNVPDTADGPRYAIPADNPFARGGGLPEIYAIGFRNPWRWSFDRGTGELWVGEVGQGQREEVDKVVLGGNYGWKCKEGFVDYDVSESCQGKALLDPVVDYGRDEGYSITGGHVYRGGALPSLIGKFIFGDYGSGDIWAVTSDAKGKAIKTKLADTDLKISSFGEGPDGEIYVVDIESGKLFKLVPPADAEPAAPFPARLSLTGCVDPADPQVPAAGLIPYEVNAPLWSDGSEKQRWMALPDGATATVGEGGDFQFPNGTVLMKTFRLEGRPVETRLFMRHPDGVWAGYSYEWNAALTDAELLPAGKTKAVGAQTWVYPSRSQCLTCHTEAAGKSLGLEVGQLNRTFAYPDGQPYNQLATLEHIGLLSAPLGPPAALTRYPEPSGAESLEGRARAYLHSNCAGCHRPEGTTQASIDLRFATPLSDTQTCDESPGKGYLGLADARILAPGAPERSVMSARIRALDAHRMPPLGSRVQHATGAELVDAWIASVTGCP
ncbi:MAG TPA: PQQ-dependent sugar dehydrogenase [Myxococcaceae bacterium]|nr:PQQ-dependent sugar dehydrogenase [Myxococcaceae bacterium]